MTRKTIKAFLAVDCPMHENYVKFETCKRCMFKEYESITEYSIECSFGGRDKK